MSPAAAPAGVDPQFAAYLRDPPRLSYANPADPWPVRRAVSAMEALFGRGRAEALYRRLKARGGGPAGFFADALREAGIEVDCDLRRLDAIPRSGPVVFVANHPYGVLDGVILCDLAIRVRGDFRILLHSLLCQDRDLARFFLPIDFDETRNARRTNIRSKQLALESLSRGVPVLIFPSGMVATAGRLGFGPVEEPPWTTFAAKIIRKARAAVVPFHFHGRNSRLFHVASHIAEPMRRALLVREALNKFGRRVRVEIGAPIPWETLERQDGRAGLTDCLRRRVRELKDQGRDAPG